MMPISLPRKIRRSPFWIADAYKHGHPAQYPKDTTLVFVNMTPRKSRWVGMDKVVVFGVQRFLYTLNEKFQEDFFNVPEVEAIEDFTREYLRFYGIMNMDLIEKIRFIHRLGYLPIKVRALKEGTAVRHGIPVIVAWNTIPEAYWLPNFIETWASAELWPTMTSATTAWYYHKNFKSFLDRTSDNEWLADWQGHNFSMRGCFGVEAAILADLGHRAAGNKGTDTCPASTDIDRFYWGYAEGFNLGGSVNATEHSVTSSGIDLQPTDTVDDLTRKEAEFLRYLLTEVYPTGILSYVSDTFDFWNMVTRVLPLLKDVILARDGKLVIRPDSSPKTPVEIIIGDTEAKEGTPEHKGAWRCLWEIFGGRVNSKGFKELNPHIGLIYGDSITLLYQVQILAGLEAMGFATEVILGIGSFTYQYVTRDTHGFAIKATARGIGWVPAFENWTSAAQSAAMLTGENCEGNYPQQIKPIFKDPKTDNSGKRSARGLLRVYRDIGHDKTCTGELQIAQYETWEEYMRYESTDELELVYDNGHIPNHISFDQIVERMSYQ